MSSFVGLLGYVGLNQVVIGGVVRVGASRFFVVECDKVVVRILMHSVSVDKRRCSSI